MQATIDGEWLQLAQGEKKMQPWSLKALVRCDADAPGGSATFRQTGPARLVIADADLLARLRFAGVSASGTLPWTPRAWAGFAASLIASLVLLALLVDRLPALLAPIVPHSLERGWSSAIEAALSATTPACHGQAGQARLDTLIGKLSAAAGIGAAPAISVLNSSLVNAFTLPDGRILLLRGLIDKATDPDEVSGVLAHEIGHVRRHDPTRETLRGMAIDMLARGIGWGGSVAGQMTALSYGRRAEAAADDSAITTLRKAGLRADGLGRFFAQLQKEGGPETWARFLSDHPTTAARATTLRVESAGAPALNPAGWAAFARYL